MGGFGIGRLGRTGRRIGHLAIHDAGYIRDVGGASTTDELQKLASLHT
jgi:hypothetical protein